MISDLNAAGRFRQCPVPGGPWLSALLLLAACGTSGEAYRPEPGSPPPPQSGDAPSLPPKTVPAPEPLLTAGDLLFISVFGQRDLQAEVRIPQSGVISFPLIGRVEAAGRSSDALEQAIRQKLEKDYLRDPSVAVTVREFSKRKVYLVGGVARPGGYEILPGGRLTLLQAVAGAEGFTDRAWKESVHVLRRKGPLEREVIRLSVTEVERAVAQGRGDADLELWPDDLVVIPTVVRVAYVLGCVHRPGTVDVPAGSRVTVSMAVSHAGSYTKFASTCRIQVLRHSAAGEVRRFTVDLDAVLDGRLDLDAPLEPGDVVWVPERGLF